MSNLPPVAHVSIVQHLYVFALLIHWRTLHTEGAQPWHIRLHRQRIATVTPTQLSCASWGTKPPFLAPCKSLTCKAPTRSRSVTVSQCLVLSMMQCTTTPPAVLCTY